MVYRVPLVYSRCDLGMGQNFTTRAPQALILGSIYQFHVGYTYIQTICLFFPVHLGVVAAPRATRASRASSHPAPRLDLGSNQLGDAVTAELCRALAQGAGVPRSLLIGLFLVKGSKVRCSFGWC